MVIRYARVQRNAGARRNLVADNEAGQKFARIVRSAFIVPHIGQREERRQDRDTGMTFGERMAIVRVD